MNFNSYEQGVMEALQLGVNSGMDPSSAFGVYQQMAAEAQQRQAERAALIQQTSGGLQELALGLASQGAPMETVAGVVASGMEPLGNGPRVDKASTGLMGLVGSIYDDQGQSQIVDPSLAAATAVNPLDDPAARQGMLTTIQSAIANSATNPEAANVEAVRQQIRFMMQPAIDSGAITPEELDQTVTDLWYSQGGPGMGMQGLAPLMEGHELLTGLTPYAGADDAEGGSSSFWGDPSDSLLESMSSGGGLLGAARTLALPITWPVELIRGLTG